MRNGPPPPSEQGTETPVMEQLSTVIAHVIRLNGEHTLSKKIQSITYTYTGDPQNK